MKKIAILTLYHNNFNYGGLLQAYALQRCLSQKGYYVKQISYELESGYSKKSIRVSLLRRVLRYIKHLNWSIRNSELNKRMHKFQTGIPHTYIVNSDTIETLEKEFDVFVCGSDQIWNPIGWQPTLFLSFVKEKTKIAYAASVATNELSEMEMNFIREMTRDFKYISVREQITADLLNSRFNTNEFNVMPDPTFLLQYDDWMAVVEKSKKNINEPYILAYFLSGDYEQRNKTIMFAKQLGIQVFFVGFLRKDIYKWEKEHMDIMLRRIGVEDFIRLIANAKYIVTDSFHGSVFSILFKKPFWVFERKMDNGMRAMQTRIETLLNGFDLLYRRVNELPDIPKDLSVGEKNNIDITLARLSKKGLDFLINAIEN